MPSLLTYPTSNGRNFLSSGWFFTKRAPGVKKDISIVILLLQTRQKNNANVLTGSSSFRRPISKTSSNKDHNNAEVHATEVKGQCCNSFWDVQCISLGHDCLTGTYIYNYACRLSIECIRKARKERKDKVWLMIVIIDNNCHVQWYRPKAKREKALTGTSKYFLAWRFDRYPKVFLKGF